MPGKIMLLFAFALASVAQASEPIKLLVPMYFYPHTTDGATSDPGWLAIADAAEDVEIVAIVNIGNGLQDPVSPGDVASYEAAIQLLDDAGVKMIGYVSSDYGCNALEDVKSAVDAWHAQWPKITGIFVDETENELISDDADPHCAKTGVGFDFGAFYSSLSTHIRDHERFDLVVFNPGTDVPDEYLAMADIIVSFESRGEHWETDHTADTQASGAQGVYRYATLIYDTGVLDAGKIDYWIELADARSYGYLHFTDDNGWGALPSYWGELLMRIMCRNEPATCSNPGALPEESSPDDSGGGAFLWLVLLGLVRIVTTRIAAIVSCGKIERST